MNFNLVSNLFQKFIYKSVSSKLIKNFREYRCCDLNFIANTKQTSNPSIHYSFTQSIFKKTDTNSTKLFNESKHSILKLIKHFDLPHTTKTEHFPFKRIRSYISKIKPQYQHNYLVRKVGGAGCPKLRPSENKRRVVAHVGATRSGEVCTRPGSKQPHSGHLLVSETHYLFDSWIRTAC